MCTNHFPVDMCLPFSSNIRVSFLDLIFVRACERVWVRVGEREEVMSIPQGEAKWEMRWRCEVGDDDGENCFIAGCWCVGTTATAYIILANRQQKSNVYYTEKIDRWISKNITETKTTTKTQSLRFAFTYSQNICICIQVNYRDHHIYIFVIRERNANGMSKNNNNNKNNYFSTVICDEKWINTYKKLIYMCYMYECIHKRVRAISKQGKKS